MKKKISAHFWVFCLLLFLSLNVISHMAIGWPLGKMASQSPPDYLVPADFFNARFIRTLPTPLKAQNIRNDQRFPIKRFRRGSVVANEADKWPSGRIPYVLSSAYTTAAEQRAILAKAIAAYNSKTCIRFVPKRPNDKDYVVISKLDGCYADFAKVGGRQQVSLADECIDYATIIHELMHVIGFIHEHQREDRDRFVTVGANADFEKLSASGLSNYGETYDYFSIMHYEATEGSRNGSPTIEAKISKYFSFKLSLLKAFNDLMADIRRSWAKALISLEVI